MPGFAAHCSSRARWHSHSTCSLAPDWLPVLSASFQPDRGRYSIAENKEDVQNNNGNEEINNLESYFSLVNKGETIHSRICIYFKL